VKNSIDLLRFLTGRFTKILLVIFFSFAGSLRYQILQGLRDPLGTIVTALLPPDLR
jgi:hypothetical protein